MTIDSLEVPTSYANLLQEFLLALLGHTGDVFVDTAPERTDNALSDPDASSFALATHVNWVSPPDRALLTELVQLGYHYQALEAYVQEEGVPVVHSTETQRSVYRRALAAGISELQQVYQGAVLKIQQHLCSEATPVLPSIRHFLLDYHTLFPQIHRLLFKIVSENLRGRQLQIVLCEMGRSGLPVLHSCIQRLLWHCNQVLYNQLSAWFSLKHSNSIPISLSRMVHGLLLDRTREFFIRENTHEPEHTRDPETPNPIVLADGDVWCTEFETVISHIPPYIDEESADRINFIGQSVKLLRHPKGSFEGQDLLPYADTLECSKNLRVLQNKAEFNRVAFDRTIECIRAKVASHLWHLVVVKAELLLHLEGLKDYFLLSRGEFYHTFLAESQKLMALPPRDATAESDILIPFMQSSLKSQTHQDKLFHSVRLRWSKDPLKTTAKNNKEIKVPQFEDGWDHLYLSFKVEWPLGLIITPALLGRYNGLFQFLLKLKRVQLELEEAWQIMCSYRRLAQMRHHMGHFILNQQIYLQHDVIEANFMQLKEDILQSQDFMKAARRHEEYVDSLLLQSFLITHTISDHIGIVFKACRTVCVFIKCDDGTDACEAASLRKVSSLARDFDNAIQNVYSLLQSSRLQEISRGPYLRQFFLRLNFNDYILKY